MVSDTASITSFQEKKGDQTDENSNDLRMTNLLHHVLGILQNNKHAKVAEAFQTDQSCT